jgi:hypothetical protein
LANIAAGIGACQLTQAAFNIITVATFALLTNINAAWTKFTVVICTSNFAITVIASSVSALTFLAVILRTTGLTVLIVTDKFASAVPIELISLVALAAHG